MSSPEAQSGSSSSSEDEVDFSTPASKPTPADAPVAVREAEAANSDADDSEPAEPKSEAARAADHSKLFSDDEDEDVDDAAAAKPEKGSDDDGRKEKEMEDLFGSDYDSEEEEFKASGIKESPVREENRSALNDAFAEDTTDPSGPHSSEVWIPKTPKAPKSASYLISKMPNILRLVPEAYTKQSIEDEMRNPSDETLYRNYVRWRYQRDESGRVKLDPQTQRPLRESNTKLVQWEDGSLTMFVGKEALNLTRQKIANSFLFVNEMSSDKPEFVDEADVAGQETVLECHARLLEKFTIRPMTTSSKSHKSLTMSMRAKHNKGVQKIKQYISELDGYREQEQRVKIMDDRLRLQNRKKARQGYEYDRERSSRMDASFLEEGFDGAGGQDYDDDENVGAIKEQFGGRGRGKAAAGRKHAQAPRRAPAQSSYHGAGFDEYRRNRAAEAEKSDSEHDDADEEQDDDEEEEMVIRSTKKRRTVDEDSD